MLGRAVCQHCRSLGDQVLAYDHQTLDISDAARVTSVLEEELPEVVINCAAWTDVDGCELDPSRCVAANAIGPENLSRAARQVGALPITVSTDYVFDGEKSGFY